MNKLFIKKLKLLRGLAGEFFYNNKFIQKLFRQFSLILKTQFEDILHFLIFTFIIFFIFDLFFPEIKIILSIHISNFIENNFYVINVYLQSITCDVKDDFTSVITYEFFSVRRRFTITEIIFWRIFGNIEYSGHKNDQYFLYLSCLNNEIKKEPLCNNEHKNK